MPTIDEELAEFYQRNMDVFSRSIRPREPFIVQSEVQKLGSQTVQNRPPPQQPVFAVPQALKAPGPIITSIEPTSGDPAGNQLVTVHGMNFFNGPPEVQLLFGGVPATLVSATSDGLIVYGYTPAHTAGVVDVKVINPDGFEDTLENGYTYTAPITGFLYFHCIPDVIVNGVITSMELQATNNSVAPFTVINYNGVGVLTRYTPYNPDVIVGTAPPLGSNITFVAGHCTIDIQAVAPPGSAYGFNLNYTDEVNLFVALSDTITLLT